LLGFRVIRNPEKNSAQFGRKKEDRCTLVGTQILFFFALDPKLVPKTGNLRFGNSKIRETG
jgi:hypothetical protein